MIDRDMVHRMADLAKLNLTPEQETEYQAEFETILQSMTALKEFDRKTDFSMDAGDAVPASLGNDQPSESFDRPLLLQNAPAQDGELILVPKTME